VYTALGFEIVFHKTIKKNWKKFCRNKLFHLIYIYKFIFVF
jgi:hypothetical protein